MLTVLTGGARSGKSSLAVRLAESSGRSVHYVATAEPLDDEMADRIARHRRERPAEWISHEVPIAVVDALGAVPADATVIVDCLALWVSNQFEEEDEVVMARAAALARVLVEREGPSIVVTNEVGSGIVPEYAMSRRYRDVLGSVNQTIARSADQAFLCVAGRALRLEDVDGIDV